MVTNVQGMQFLRGSPRYCENTQHAHKNTTSTDMLAKTNNTLNQFHSPS